MGKQTEGWRIVQEKSTGKYFANLRTYDETEIGSFVGGEDFTLVAFIATKPEEDVDVCINLLVKVALAMGIKKIGGYEDFGEQITVARGELAKQLFEQAEG